MRRLVNNKIIIPADVVKIEEMLNYFNQRYTNLPLNSNEVFTLTNYTTSCPWSEQQQLLHIQIAAKELDNKNTKPNKLTFLIDCSGSMDEGNRLPIVQSAFKMLAKQMKKNDTITLITFGADVVVWLENIAGTDHSKIIPVIDSLGAAGETPGELALVTAYNKALKYYNPNANNRIIICTDGDFNVGRTEEDELEQLVSRYKESGIYLTVLGIGRGNFKNSKLESLAKKGNGNFAYIDSEAEAEKILVKEGLQTLVSISDNVTMNIEFDKNIVMSYRLIGFDNQLKHGMERLNELEGGTVGSGHIINAIFEINFKDGIVVKENEPIANAVLQYTLIGSDKKTQKQLVITNNTNVPDSIKHKVAFNNGLAGLGLVLRNSPNKKAWNLLSARKHFASISIDNLYLQNDINSFIEKTIKLYPKKFKK